MNVRINEIVVSTTGVDTEFLELLGTPGFGLSGLTLLTIRPEGTVDRVIDIAGVLGGNGYFLLASPEAETSLGITGDQQIANNSFTNSTRTYLLVDGFTGTSGQDLDTDGDGAFDLTPWTSILDSVAAVDALGATVFSTTIIGPDGAFMSPGGFRSPEGTGDFVQHSFDDFSAFTPTAAASAQIVINEIVVSTTATDTEFVEFLGTPGLDLTDYALLEIEPGGEIDTVIDLVGTVGENGYFLVTSPAAEALLGVTGNQSMADNTFTNDSRTYLLVKDFSGATGDDIDANDDGVIDFAPWSGIADSVAPINASNPLIYSANVIGPDGTFLSPGGFRSPEGTGAFVQHSFNNFSSYTPTAGTAAPVALVINEVDADTPGTDVAEFIELFDGGVGGTALDGYVVVLFNGSNDLSYAAFDLDGFSTNADGYFVLGNAGVANVGLIFGSNGLQNGADAVALYRGDAADFPTGTAPTTANLVDALVYDTSDADDPGLLAGLGQTVQANENANAAGTTDSNSRVPNGTGDFVAQAPTPGTANDAPPPPVDEITLISTIQGSGTATLLAGVTVTVEAIVVGDFQTGDADTLRDLRGFYLQEEFADRDADAMTSEGLFVFDGSFLVDVLLGDLVRVTGTVSEFQGQTQISATSITVVTPGAVADVNTLAVDVSLDAIDDVVTDGAGKYVPDLEAYEGMLVTVTDTLTVTEMFQLDRFNEIRLSADGRPEQFTQFADPDPVAYDAYQRATGSDWIVFDDGLNVQNAPILPEADLDGDGDFDTADGFTMGDTITGLTGVMTWGWAGNSASPNTWRVRSVDEGNTFVDTNTRDETPPEVGGSLTVATFNVLNFFTTLDVAGNPGAGPSGLDPRGADNAAEFERQLDKLLTTLLEINADVYGLVEVENEFTFDQNGDGQVAIEVLAQQLNVRLGSEVFAAVDVARGFVDTSDAISVGLLYRTDTVALVEGSVEILDDSDLPDLGLTGPIFDGANSNRAPLAATFEDLSTGEDFTVAVTHMKSKGGTGTGGDADQNDGAGAYNETRTKGVEAMTAWLASFADEDLLVLGDFNAYAMEDPIDAMKAAGYTDLAATLGPDAPSFVFDGKTGTLDYAFGSAGVMDNVTGAAAWTINSDEPDALDYNTDFGRDPAIFDGSVPFRSSDHDPILVGLKFDPVFNLVAGTAGRDILVGTEGRDRIEIGGGVADIARGLGGDDIFDFTANLGNGTRDVTRIMDWNLGDVIEGFGLDDVALETVRGSTNALRLSYGPDGDLLVITGDLPGDVGDLFGAYV